MNTHLLVYPGQQNTFDFNGQNMLINVIDILQLFCHVETTHANFPSNIHLIN